MQPSLFYKCEFGEKRPLLVGLHTWSFDRFNQIENLLPMAKRLGFNLLLPEFRGANLDSNPECAKACGSQYAKADIKDAIDCVIENENADGDNVFLLGLSGGGHMALLMAGAYPEYFKAVGAFVPITNLEKWVKQNEGYARHVLACCGGDKREMEKRSPMHYIDAIARANVKIFHGKRDTVVPPSHSLELFSAVMKKHPDASIYLDIFDGGHEIDLEVAEHWIVSQYKKSKNASVTG